MNIGISWLAAGILFAGPLHAAPEPGYDFLPLALNPATGEFPEGIALDRRGNLYYSLAPRGEIWQATPEGELTLFAALDPDLPEGSNGALGLATGRGGVYAALMACNATECNDTHGVWRMPNSRHQVRLTGTEHIAFPNALAFGRHGELYVSDTLTGAVWVLHRQRHRHGGTCRNGHGGPFSLPEIWVQDDVLLGTGALGLGAPIGANGLVYTRGATAGDDEVLVANTERGALVAIPVESDGGAGMVEVVAEDPALLTIDGIAGDDYGDVLALTVARVGAAGLEPVSQLLHVHRDSGEIRLLLAGPPLHFSTSLTFGSRGGTEESLFVTNWALLAPLFGLTPEPGVLRINLEHTWFVAAE
ncbi:MAG: SMP-30/gluconolactonase/LRE family protein [Gammaproteobacteria bacterium]